MPHHTRLQRTKPSPSSASLNTHTQNRGGLPQSPTAGTFSQDEIIHLQRTIGNVATQRLIAGESVGGTAQAHIEPILQRTPLGEKVRKTRLMRQVSSRPISMRTPQVIQRENFLHRWRRIIGRWINKKKLPTNTYRWDTRAADVIAQVGFQSWKSDGTISIEEHVNNAFMSGAKKGQMAKKESQWVSTGGYGMLKKLDPTFAQQVLNTHLYRIDTSAAKTAGNFNDANDHFDKIGQARPYASQREWIKEGGVPGASITHWMTGKTFLDQYDFTTGAPDEGALTGWQAMPVADVEEI